MASKTPRALIWHITKKHNSFRVKRDGAVISRHPMNPTGKYSPRFDGISNSKAVTVNLSAKGGVVVSFKSAKKAHQPKNAIIKVVMDKRANNPRALSKSIRALTAKTAGRPDLQDAVAARFARVHKIVHRKSGGVSKKYFKRGTQPAAAVSSSSAQE